MQSFHVTAIGNAIVDVLSNADDAFLQAEGLAKGTMALIDAERAETLYKRMGPTVTMSGGSAGNTAAGLATLGARTAYIGKVKNDGLGKVFKHDIEAVGVHYSTAFGESASTARCLILVTPDGERTMNTFLGACVELTPDDIDEAVVAASDVTYLEGYLWDPPQAKEAFVKAAKCAHRAGKKVALTLSDPFCVARHRDSFRDLVYEHVDILFANENEILSLYEADDFDSVVDRVASVCETAALTRSSEGSVVLHDKERFTIAAEPIAKVVDTTGAGDLYAAGFLYGYTQGLAPPVWGKLGAVAAAEIIAHFGARPEADLNALAQAALT